MLIDFSDDFRQVTLARLVGVDPSAISHAVAEGRLPAGGTLADALLAYCHRLREQAAGRLGAEPGGLDLATERAALARAQREGIEIKNAALRGQYAPIPLLAEVLATASQAVAERFDHLPGRLRKACPTLPARAMDEVLTVVAAARNEWVRETAELVSRRVLTPDDDDAGGQAGAEGDAA